MKVILMGMMNEWGSQNYLGIKVLRRWKRPKNPTFGSFICPLCEGTFYWFAGKVVEKLRHKNRPARQQNINFHKISRLRSQRSFVALPRAQYRCQFASTQLELINCVFDNYFRCNFDATVLSHSSILEFLCYEKYFRCDICSCFKRPVVCDPS